MDISLVAGAGNNGHLGFKADDGYPAALHDFEDLGEVLIVAAAVGEDGKPFNHNQYFTDDPNARKTSHAPGYKVFGPDEADAWMDMDGTSYATAKISGLVAYLRSLESPQKDVLRNPAAIKTLIRRLERPVFYKTTPKSQRVPFIWNGHVLDEHCLNNPENPKCGDTFDDLTPGACSSSSAARLSHRAAGDYCLPGNGNGSGGSGDIDGVPIPGPIEWTEGNPNPICTSHCGSLCEGYYCTPQPTGTPPGHDEPEPPSDDEPEDPPDDDDPPTDPPDDGDDDDDDDFPTGPATFYLIDGAWVTESGDPHILTRAVKESDWPDCDPIDHSPELDGAEGDVGYPWPEDNFTVELCDKNLRFKKTGDDYDVYNDDSDKQIGVCTEGSGYVKSCFWGFISAQYAQSYKCTGAC